MPAACRAAYRRHRPTPHAFGPRVFRPAPVVPTGSALPRESIDDRLVLVGVVAEVAILFALILVPPLRAIFGRHRSESRNGAHWFASGRLCVGGGHLALGGQAGWVCCRLLPTPPNSTPYPPSPGRKL